MPSISVMRVFMGLELPFECRSADSAAFGRSVPSGELQGAALVRGDVIGLVAPDLVLRIVLARATRVALVVEVLRVDGDDGARYPAGLGIPGDVIADLEALGHGWPPCAGP